MPTGRQPFSIHSSFEFPTHLTVGLTNKKTAATQKDQRVWDELLPNQTFKRMVDEIRRRRRIRICSENKIAELTIRAFRSGQLSIKKAMKRRDRVKAKDVVSILKTFKLTPLWYGAIQHYIFSGEKWFPPSERTSQPIPCEDSFGQKRLLVEIFADTDQAGFLRSWKGLCFYQKHLPGYDRKWGRSEETALRKQIVALHRKGLKPTGIYKHLVQKLEPEDDLGEPKAYDAWEDKKENLLRSIYRVCSKRGATASVT